MQEAFDWNVEQYLFYGGYPGAAPLNGSRNLQHAVADRQSNFQACSGRRGVNPQGERTTLSRTRQEF